MNFIQHHLLPYVIKKRLYPTSAIRKGEKGRDREIVRDFTLERSSLFDGLEPARSRNDYLHLVISRGGDRSRRRAPGSASLGNRKEPPGDTPSSY